MDFSMPSTADSLAASGANTDHPANFAGALQGTPIIPLLLVFIVFYFMVIRPQNQRAAEHRKMIANLQKGDKVVTGGGLVATVKKVVSDEEVVLELGEGVQVTALRATIMSKKA
jgi:preprotein translocase subunit YajC